MGNRWTTTIATKEGPREVECVGSGMPGLVLTVWQGDPEALYCWTLTHAPTGRTVGSMRFRSVKHAWDCIDAVRGQMFCDWTFTDLNGVTDVHRSWVRRLYIARGRRWL